MFSSAKNSKGSSQYLLFNRQGHPFTLNSDHQMLHRDAGLWSCQTYDQNVSFYSVRSTWYWHISLNRCCGNSREYQCLTSLPLHQRPPLGHQANGRHRTFSPKQSIRLRCHLSWSAPRHRRKAATVALLEPCQPQHSLLCPHAPPPAIGTIPTTAKQLLSWQAQAHAWMHEGVASCADWPTCHH